MSSTLTMGILLLISLISLSGYQSNPGCSEETADANDIGWSEDGKALFKFSSCKTYGFDNTSYRLFECFKGPDGDLLSCFFEWGKDAPYATTSTVLHGFLDEAGRTMFKKLMEMQDNDKKALEVLKANLTAAETREEKLKANLTAAETREEKLKTELKEIKECHRSLYASKMGDATGEERKEELDKSKKVELEDIVYKLKPSEAPVIAAQAEVVEGSKYTSSHMERYDAVSSGYVASFKDTLDLSKDSPVLKGGSPSPTPVAIKEASPPANK